MLYGLLQIMFHLVFIFIKTHPFTSFILLVLLTWIGSHGSKYPSVINKVAAYLALISAVFPIIVTITSIILINSHHPEAGDADLVGFIILPASLCVSSFGIVCAAGIWLGKFITIRVIS